MREYFLEKAKQLKPELNYNTVKPQSLATPYFDKVWKYKTTDSIEKLDEIVFDKGDSVCVDFGTHYVGYVSFDISSVGNPPDAPAYLGLKFGENICEIGEDSANYSGDLSSSWIQEEFIHIDVIPSRVVLPRRYAFRFMEIYVKDVSKNFKIKISNIECRSVSSANMENVPEISGLQEELMEIDRVSVKTMYECMQDVFEDGPKRDRRLWIGDLRLQALTNYYTFKNNDLVKRCLYLFAGTANDEGVIPSCLFLEPKVIADNIYLFDYSLFFVSSLHDYYFETKDTETLNELWDTAYAQIDVLSKRIDDNMLIKDSDDWWCFIDWNDDLNKQAGAQAIFIYALKQALKLSEICGSDEQTERISQLTENLTFGAKKYLWDEKQGFFVSGKNKQISWASQIWFVLAGIFDDEKNKELLTNLIGKNPDIKMKTPYMWHHFADACVSCGMTDAAVKILKDYWGGMVKDGADCFYEAYDPDDKLSSPYGSPVINSYCHAWSATPSYFIRKYFKAVVN